MTDDPALYHLQYKLDQATREPKCAVGKSSDSNLSSFFRTLDVHKGLYTHGWTDQDIGASTSIPDRYPPRPELSEQGLHFMRRFRKFAKLHSLNALFRGATLTPKTKREVNHSQQLSAFSVTTIRLIRGVKFIHKT